MTTRARYYFDPIGEGYEVIQLKDFDAWFNTHKDTISKMHMRTFNRKFHIVDGSHRYKLVMRKNQFILKRANPDYFLDKHDLVNKINELAVSLEELKKVVEAAPADDNDDSVEEPKINLDVKTKMFKV